jgi:HEAT repeat protein
MKNWLYIVLGAMLAAALVWAGWQAVRQPGEAEPLYRGKPFSRWISEPEGAEAVRQAGTNGIPTLLQLLRAEDSTLKIWAMYLVRKQRIIPDRFTSAYGRMSMAAAGFSYLGADAQSAVPALIEVADQNLSSKSAYDSYRRSQAIMSLGRVGRPARETVPALLRYATNADPGVRGSAGFALMCIDPELASKAGLKLPPLAPGNIALLISELATNKAASIRFQLAGELGVYGRGDQTVTAALIAALNDNDRQVRWAVTNALLQLDPEAAVKAGVKAPSP